jgi:serine/threonine protein kinase
MLSRPAAIKLIRPSVAGDTRAGVSEAAVHRFEREAQVIARLRSPHTVELFDFGRAEDGAFYYVMELLDGLDADSLLRRFGPTPPERAIYLLRQVCHSLSEAQSCGLVHRDIKPANIFLCRYGEEYDFVKVLDFGIVGAVRDSADPSPVHTRENAVHGTPAFIAPEQAMGKVLDGRADIYATGCVAYWLLTGQFVFTAETSMGLLLQHAQTPAVPPSARTDLPIPPALDALVLSCLAKDPAKRPQTARELSLTIERSNLSFHSCSAAVGETSMQLIRALETTRDETLKYFSLDQPDLMRTYGPGKWSVRYILLHLSDSETVLFDRIRRVLSEPRQVLWVYDQDAWAKGLDYSQTPLDLSRRVYESVRNAIIYYAGKYYEQKGHLEFVHSVTGVRTLKDEFDKVASHNEHHLGQIRSALKE